MISVPIQCLEWLFNTFQRPRFVEARSDEQSRKERQRRQMMTEEEVAEETARRPASERVKQVETH